MVNAEVLAQRVLWQHSMVDAYPENLLPENSDGTVTTAGSAYSYSNQLRLDKDNEQDVMILKEIIQQLPPEAISLLFGQPQGDDASVHSGLSVLSGTGSRSTSPMSIGNPPSASCSSGNNQMPHMVKSKKTVRFCMDSLGEMEIDVCEYEAASDPELWWSRKELFQIRKECRSIVDYFMAKNPHYIDSISAALLRSNKKEFASAHATDSIMECINGNEHLLQTLIQNYDARGLEQHIVDRIRTMCKQHIDNVIKETNRARAMDWDRDSRSYQKNRSEQASRLKRVALETSRSSLYLARKLAICDRLISYRDQRLNQFQWSTTKSTTTSSAPSPEDTNVDEGKRQRKKGWFRKVSNTNSVAKKKGNKLCTVWELAHCSPPEV